MASTARTQQISRTRFSLPRVSERVGQSGPERRAGSAGLRDRCVCDSCCTGDSLCICDSCGIGDSRCICDSCCVADHPRPYRELFQPRGRAGVLAGLWLRGPGQRRDGTWRHQTPSVGNDPRGFQWDTPNAERADLCRCQRVTDAGSLSWKFQHH